jgi:hypothetical protein
MFYKTKGKGKGKRFGKHRRLSGKGVSTLIADLTDAQYTEVFFGKGGKGKGRGHSKGKRSTGKGFGRKGNPVGKDGQKMKCYGKGGNCGSTEHLKAQCPHETGAPSSTLLAESNVNPYETQLDDNSWVFHMMTTEEHVFMITTSEEPLTPGDALTDHLGRSIYTIP